MIYLILSVLLLVLVIVLTVTCSAYVTVGYMLGILVAICLIKIERATR